MWPKGANKESGPEMKEKYNALWGFRSTGIARLLISKYVSRRKHFIVTYMKFWDAKSIALRIQTYVQA